MKMFIVLSIFTSIYYLCMLNMFQKKQIKIKEVIIYKNTVNNGFTTVGAISYFKKIEKNNPDTFHLSNNEIKRIEEIINNIECKKFFQIKHPPELIFAVIKLDGNNSCQSSSYVLILANNQHASITDLTYRKIWFVKNKNDVEFLWNLKLQVKK